MNILAFSNESKTDIDRFLAVWMNRHKESPDDWPIEMEPGEWFEQFLAFLTTPELFNAQG